MADEEIGCPCGVDCVEIGGEVIETGENWLGCIPWLGGERELPAGGQIRNPQISISDLVKSYIKTSKGKIISVVIDEDVYDTIIADYGPKGITIAPPDGSAHLTREAWRDKYKTDGLKLWAIADAKKGSPTPTPLGKTGGSGPEPVQIGGAAKKKSTRVLRLGKG